MQACARVKWRFRRRAAVVLLRDDPKFGDFVVSCSRASPRDSTSITLRLPRRCAPRNDTKLGRLYLGNGRFCFMRPFRAETLRTVFQTFPSENRLLGGCSCPESAAGRNKSAVRRKNTQPGKQKKPADILDFLNSFSILYALFFSKYHRQIRQENRNLFVYFAD